MKSYQIKFSQKLPISLEAAWDFFSSPLNLSKITPPEMTFEVTSDLTAETKMYPGMIITYKVSPLLGIKLNWMTEITQVMEGKYFIDEQRFGPFKFWHHQHHFKAIEGGVEMTDILTYGLPLGILGKIAQEIQVKGQIAEIFKFREKRTNELFGKYEY
jgi:ligand-binding SRPBCC domain-containing protein